MSKTPHVVIKDIYEATFYITQGARFVSVRTRTVRENRAKKIGYKVEWLIGLRGVTYAAICDWKSYKAQGNIREFTDARINLKRKIKKYLTQLTKPTT